VVPEGHRWIGGAAPEPTDAQIARIGATLDRLANDLGGTASAPIAFLSRRAAGSGCEHV